MIESKLSKRIKAMLPRLWPQSTPFWLRVENSAAIGTFDAFVGSGMGCGWVELKQGGPNAKPDMRKGQAGFGFQCHKAGVPAHVLMVSDNGYVKLLNGWTLGPDWRDHLQMEGRLDDKDSMRAILVRCMTGGDLR